MQYIENSNKNVDEVVKTIEEKKSLIISLEFYIFTM